MAELTSAAEPAPASPGPPALSERMRAIAPWVRIAVIYVVARVVTIGFFLLAASHSAPGSRFGPHPTLFDYILGWDAQWYWLVAVNGYPTDLPMTDGGDVAENAWAFLPVFAHVANIVGLPFGSWGAGAAIVSLVAGFLSCLVLYRLLRTRLDDGQAMWAVVFFACGPLAALFHVGYAESLFLLWLFLALWMLVRRRYGWLYVLIPLMGFTRPGVLAFALLMGLHGIVRWFTRRKEPLPTRDIVHIVALAVLGIVVGFAWQVIAGLVTGDQGAYLATELAWRRNWLGSGQGHFIPFEGFVQGAAFWFGSWGLGAATGYVALALGVLAIGAFLVFAPQARRLGPEIRLWTASYLLYLLAVFFPQSSVFRLLVPISPVWGAFAVPKSTAWRVGVLAMCLLGQWWWIHEMYGQAFTYWQIP